MEEQVRIELSPGEWAGVLHCVMQESRRLDRLTEEYETDFREQAEDLRRIGRLMREAIDAAGRELPELPAGEPGTRAACPECGEELAVRKAEIEYRRYAEWTRDGAVVVGGWDASDSVPDEPDVMLCPNGHGEWALPDVEDYR
jgi:hypothetical protein